MPTQSKEFFKHKDKTFIEGEALFAVPKKNSWDRYAPPPEKRAIKYDVTITASCSAMVWENGTCQLSIEFGVGKEDKKVHGWVAGVIWRGGEENTLVRREYRSSGPKPDVTRYDDFYIGLAPEPDVLRRLITDKWEHEGSIVVDKKKMRSKYYEKEDALEFPRTKAVEIMQGLIDKYAPVIEEAIQWVKDTRASFKTATVFDKIEDAIAKPGVYQILHRRHGYKFSWELRQGKSYQQTGDTVFFKVAIESTKLGEVEHSRIGSSSFELVIGKGDGVKYNSNAINLEGDDGSKAERALDLEEIMARNSEHHALSALIAMLGESGFDKFAETYRRMMSEKMHEVGLMVSREQTHHVADESAVGILSRTQRFLKECHG